MPLVRGIGPGVLIFLRSFVARMISKPNAPHTLSSDPAFWQNGSMTTNLLRDNWIKLDSAELRLLLDNRIGRPGQFQDRSNNPNKFYLPLAGSSCRICLTFREKKIVTVEPGPAFDADEWEQISEEIETSILAGPTRVGREYSFSSFRVQGWWRGEHSGVQILPPPLDAPRAPVEMAVHPFILEFAIKSTELWPITNHRRMQEHRKLTHLLNVLLAGRTSIQPRRPEHFWAAVPHDDNNHQPEIKWVQQFFFAKLGEVVVDDFASPDGDQLEEVDAEGYYTEVGHDGKGLRVPSDLDYSIGLYLQLSSANRAKFDRAVFWMDMASRQWDISVSSSFASLVSAVEALTKRGTTHRLYCEQCGVHRQHEMTGATESFRAFFETYAPGTSTKSRRTKMYSLRSGILHGSDLMQLDQDLHFGWDPPWWNERELHDDLWRLTGLALRNWLHHPPMTT